MPQKPWKKRLHNGNPVVAAGIKIPKYDSGNTVHRRLAEIGKGIRSKGPVSQEHTNEIES